MLEFLVLNQYPSRLAKYQPFLEAGFVYNLLVLMINYLLNLSLKIVFFPKTYQ